MTVYSHARLLLLLGGISLGSAGAQPVEPSATVRISISYQELARLAARGIAPLVWQLQPDMTRTVLQSYVALPGVIRMEVHEGDANLFARVEATVPVPDGPRCHWREPVLHEGRPIAQVTLTLRCPGS